MFTQVPYMFCVFICKLFQASHLWCHTFTWPLLFCFFHSRISFHYNAYYLHLSHYGIHSLLLHVHHHPIITVIACNFYFQYVSHPKMLTKSGMSFFEMILCIFTRTSIVIVFTKLSLSPVTVTLI